MPTVADVTVAKRLLYFLDDRRVLYMPFGAERVDLCVESVREIRAKLTATLDSDEVGEDLARSTRALRAACHKFLANCEQLPGSVEVGMARQIPWAS